MPNADLVMKDKSLHPYEIYSSSFGCSLTIYKAEKKKVVCMLSLMYRNVNIDRSRPQKETARDGTVLQQIQGGCRRTGPDG